MLVLAPLFFELLSTLKTCPECHSEYDEKTERCPVDSTPLKSTEMDPLVGTRLGDRYEIVSIIGRGGMGVVYKARQEQMDKLMAIKMLHSHMVSDSEAVKRFYREAKTVSQVRHHHIVTLYDFGMSSQGQPFLVMDFLEGVSIKDELKMRGPLSFERTERIVAQITDALATAHSMDVVHRDLKPENILLSTQNHNPDWVTLVDFGLSKLKEPKTQDAYTITKTGDVCGSPPYMSPEQCLAASAVDPRSDIYSLAIVVYECLSGTLPYQAKSAIEMMDCHLYGTPIPFNLSCPEMKVCSELTNFFSKALAKEPENRHADILEFGKDFKAALSRDGIKLKSYKHRMEKAEFKDMESEAEALMSGTYPALGPNEGQVSVLASQRAMELVNKTMVDAPQVDQRMSSQANQSIQTQQSLTGQYGKMDADGAANRSWISRVMSAVMGTREKGTEALDTEGLGNGEGLSNLPYTNCPYCNTPVRSLIKFCISCQRQLPSATEYAKMRVRGNGRLGHAASQQVNSRGSERVGFSNRAKDAMSARAHISIQRWLTVALLGVLAYYFYGSLNNPEFQKAMRGIVQVIKK
jgi:serine/threonine protein kinase